MSVISPTARVRCLLALTLVGVFLSNSCHGFVSPSCAGSHPSQPPPVPPVVSPGSSCSSRTPNKHSVHAALPTAVASLLAGSVAGALGVGVAYPLDTIKTKAQVLAAEASSISGDGTTLTYENNSENDYNEEDWFDWGTDGTATAAAIPVPGAHASMWQVARYIYHTSDGAAGFFGGVQSSMMGQALIKAVVFCVNASVLDYATTHHLFGDVKFTQLLVAAAVAGFVTSFLAAPVDRIKVLMQCSDHECYSGDEKACMNAVLAQEGWRGLFSRGLLCTMVREIPAYSLYFGVYGSLQAFGGDLTTLLGPTWAPALYGATAGCACWLPIYPIDVVRTVTLNTEGQDVGKSAWEVAVELYQTSGWEAFYDGLEARLLRQAVNHGVTFSVYEVLMRMALYEQTDIFA